MWSRNALGTSATASGILEVYAATYPYQMDPVIQVVVVANDLLSTIKVTWTPAAYTGGLPVVGYYLMINGGYGSSYLPAQHQVLASESDYTFENLIAGATYKIKIAAYNLLEADNMQFDDELNFSDDASFLIANVPDQVTEFSQSLVDYEAGKAKLLWKAPADNGSTILYYVVMRDVGSGVYFEVYKGLETKYTDEGLYPGYDYHYKVKAYNPIGFGQDSD